MARLIRKPIRYEQHALIRVNQRGITEAQVESAIKDPHERRPAKRAGAWRITHKLNAVEAIVVIVEEEPELIRVVTCWMTHA
ncbi:MAG TPA: DUF4258 domain-containing protein [Tepidisphaeraceae bacterium]|jgi:hypothetical protein|nr:DUF4258 domain-containing protein [Tepidisphaeraceae bacterium]